MNASAVDPLSIPASGIILLRFRWLGTFGFVGNVICSRYHRYLASMSVLRLDSFTLLKSVQISGTFICSD